MVTYGKTANYKTNHSHESAETGCLDCIGGSICAKCHLSDFGGAIKSTHNVSISLK